MRITSSMLANESRKSGIPLAQGNLLDMLNNQNKASNLTDIMNKSKNAKKASAMQKEYRELENGSADLKKYAEMLTDTGEDSLFGKAEEKKETEDILSTTKDMIKAYNRTIELLKNASGSLNSFYYKELKNAVSGSTELLKALGITQNKDGSLTADYKRLESADYDTLKKVFGEASEFVQKAGYIGERVSENARANAASVTNQYNAKGITASDYTVNHKYNFFG